jgi:FMN phosphatase YigB (HAD superfamily)
MTNREKFVRYFSARTGLDEAQLWKIFIHFYQTDFKEISRITTKVTGIRDLLKQAIASGYRLILATQPVFPEIAIRQRMSWAGVDDLEFEFVTDIDSMNACKPSPVYYRQILERLAAQPADCLMIGNDPVTDVGAGKVGIRTFLLNNGTDENGCPADFCGSLNDLARLLRLETEQVG